MQLSIEQQKLAEENIGLVRGFIFKSVHGLDRIGLYTYDDLYQIGCEGLCKAAYQHRPELGSFSIYAYICIRSAIYAALKHATVKRKHEVPSELTEDNCVVNAPEAPLGVHAALQDAKQSCSSKVAQKGIDAMLLMSMGYTSGQIGAMYGTNCHNVTAWVSKARKALKNDPAFMRIAS